MSENSHIYYALDEVPSQPSCITIGNFDGVHLGHLALIELTQNQAKVSKINPLLITFEPHPQEFFTSKSKTVTKLNTLKQRLELLQATGINILLLNFNTHLAQLSAQDFVQTILMHHLHLQHLAVGYDFTLGRNRSGTFEVLQSLSTMHGFGLSQLPALNYQDLTISSTNIRKALSEGNVALARACLSRPYRLSGTVVHGYHRGTGMGFPTANLGEIATLLPGKGVYLTRTHLQQGSFASVTNIGVKPTFNDPELTVETHILDFNADIYEQPMHLDFLERLRPEQSFASIDDLKNQLNQDIVQAKSLSLKYSLT